MSVPVRAALNLAAAGWRVLPLNGKRPFLHDWVNLATTDRKVIKRWWRMGDFNVGAVIPDNHVVIDIDPHNGGSLAALEDLAGVEMPPTLSIYSGRGDGSVHLHYLRPFPKVTAKRMPEGIDILAQGRQMVMPPSIHPATSKPYTWGPEAPVARLPLEVAALIKPRPSRYRSRRKPGEAQEYNISTLVTWFRGRPKGSRHDALLDAAVILREGHAPERHINKVIEAAVDLGFAPEEARRVIESVRTNHT